MDPSVIDEHVESKEKARDNKRKPPPEWCSSSDCSPQKELHIAPMLDFSKREFRKLFSILSTQCVLWTDMVVDDTIAHSDKLQDLLGFDKTQNRLVCQIGGNSPLLCGEATCVVEDYGYDEINLNIDCPSDRVSGEREFGAALMKKAEVAFAVVESMSQSAKSMNVSVKCRVGVDDFDNLEYVAAFIQKLRPVCKRFVLHARKCVLGGLMNARQNRSVPPLNFPRVYELCNMFPDCQIWINGGIRGLKHAKSICYGTNNDNILDSALQEEKIHVDLHTISSQQHSVPCSLCNASYGSCIAPPVVAPPNLRGCMMGRAAIDNPSIFWDVDRYFCGLESNPCQNRRQVFEKYCLYLEELYPRRCCDKDDRATFKIPVPDVIRECEYCHVCRDVYEGKDGAKTVVVEPIPKDHSKGATKTKITSRIIGRALKPVRGMFYGLPKSKVFLRACDKLCMDTSVRNCGPGFILRMALRVMPDRVLDQDFVKTEDLSTTYN
jgi:tRNA-dihydrouridine synthase A